MEMKDIFIVSSIALFIVIISALFARLLYKRKNKSNKTIYEFDRDDVDE